MELVFFYINQTSSKFIEKKGFNFSANYNFNVEYFDGRYVLKQNECNVRLPEYFFDDKGCITTYGYNDNPFLFFKALRNMYICELDKSKASKPLDYVEKAIIQTNFFWKLFGNGEEGYAECERAFCVSGILELCEDDKYKEFLCEKIPEEEGWSFYETLLDELRILRTVQMKKRFTELKNVENP